MPYILSTLVGRTVGVSLPAGPLLKALVETLLVPLLLGKVRITFRNNPVCFSPGVDFRK